ncbi:MAG: hypothetical protein K8T26_02880 [Lentisphaerae bacterium]|nr:hypothetical protein [Lentisphaerota bacterium]
MNCCRTQARGWVLAVILFGVVALIPVVAQVDMQAEAGPVTDAAAVSTAEPAHIPDAITPTWQATLDSAGPNLRAAPRRLRDFNLPGLENRVNLKSIEPWDVVQLIEFLAYRGGLNNIVIGNGVAGLATKLKFEDVTVGDALEVVLSVNNLAYEVKGDIISIMTDLEYQNTHGVSFYDQKQVRIVELKYADATRVAGMLGSIKSEIGTVVADPLTGTLILIDAPAKIAEMRSVIDKADISTVSRVIPTETQTYQISHASVDTLEKAVEKLLTPNVGSVQADPRTKTMIVTDLAHNMKRITDMVALFDKRPKQVFIEAKIMEISLSDKYQMGVNWNTFYESLDPRSALSAAVRSPTFGPDNPGIGSLTYRTIMADGSDLEAMVDALKIVGDTKLLSNPHVAVIDGEEASIKVVQDTPYAETSAEITGSDTNFVGETIKFIEVGVILTVTPQIGDDGFIQMAIRPEVSSASYDYQAFRQIPVVKKQYSETTVMIKDGETIIIAGMIQNGEQNVEQRVPVLGRIPLLGFLFRTTSNETDNRELVVFLTPREMSGAEPVLRMKDMKKRPKPLRAAGAPESAAKTFKPVR